MDHVLLMKTIRVVDNTNNIVQGNIIIQQNEMELSFMPFADWKPGKYILEMESRPEDLAGNNLSRLFDNDLSSDKRISNSMFLKNHLLYNDHLTGYLIPLQLIFIIYLSI